MRTNSWLQLFLLNLEFNLHPLQLRSLHSFFDHCNNGYLLMEELFCHNCLVFNNSLQNMVQNKTSNFLIGNTYFSYITVKLLIASFILSLNH